MGVASSERSLLDLLDVLYASIEDDDALPRALTSFASLLDARAAGVRIETRARGVEQLWVGLEASFDRAYVQAYWRDDPWARRVWSAEVGMFAHGDELCSRAAVEASSYHNELALSYGFDDLCGGLLERSNDRVITLAAMKGLGRHRFDETTDAIARRIVPHFTRVLALRDRVRSLGVVSESSPARDVREQLVSHLRSVYTLTETEALVAIRIGSGRSPKEIAFELGCSWNTVRSHLRQIFAKTEHRTQSALAHLVTLAEAKLARANALANRTG